MSWALCVLCQPLLLAGMRVQSLYAQSNQRLRLVVDPYPLGLPTTRCTSTTCVRCYMLPRAALVTYRTDGSADVSPVWYRCTDSAFRVVVAADDRVPVPG